MHRLVGRGYEQLCLGVDAENTTGAADLYLRIGMKPTRVLDFYERRLGAG